jgi:transcriptional regulator with XRE-family HTH domain
MKVTSPQELGNVLRAVRVGLNVPLADLAETLNTSQTLLRRQEQGEATVAVEKLFQPCENWALNCTSHCHLPSMNAPLLPQRRMASRRARP